MPKPFVKWVGGKRFLEERILKIFPKKIDIYYEPFVGGGAIFFALAKRKRFNTAVLSDMNEELIIAYKAVRDEVDAVIHHLTILKDEYFAKGKEEYYYKVREMDRDEQFKTLPLAARCARLIFMNRTGFNGLYRVNRRGFFNVPHGKYKNPKIVDPGNLKLVSAALKNVNIGVADFEQAVHAAGSGDVVYLDPPYWPVKSDSFTGYNSTEFDSADHVRLARIMSVLKGKGAFALQSNSDVTQVRDLNRLMSITSVDVPRRINSNVTQRGTVKELLICTHKIGL